MWFITRLIPIEDHQTLQEAIKMSKQIPYQMAKQISYQMGKHFSHLQMDILP